MSAELYVTRALVLLPLALTYTQEPGSLANPVWVSSPAAWCNGLYPLGIRTKIG